MSKSQYQHVVAERSVRAGRVAAFAAVCDLNFVTPDGVTRTVQSDEPPWRRVWQLEGASSRYTALSAHIVAGPDVADPQADDIDLLLVVSLMSELTEDSPARSDDFDGLERSAEQFATTWAERLA